MKILLKTFAVTLAFAIVVFSGCNNSPATTGMSAVDSTAEIYTCSMHPQVMEHEPGHCPICGMTLVKKENASREISKVDLSTLLQPTNQAVISSIPVTTLQFGKQQVRVDALGSIEYDTRFMRTIAARVSGRIEKLYIKYRYQPVHAGDKIMDIYSPELLTGQQNLLLLLKNDPENVTLINAAKQKLLLLGMNAGQLQNVIATGKAHPNVVIYSNYSGHVHEAGNMINTAQPVNTLNETGELSIKEGMYIEKGRPVFQVNNMDHLWVSLNFFAGDISLVKVGMPVTIIPETSPGNEIHSKLSFIEPFYRNDSKTLTARVYFDNSKLMLQVGSQVKATVDINTSMGNWLPQEAVLSLGLNKVVFLKTGNAFTVHPVSTGIAVDDLISITGGLSDKDSVAVNAQFLIDSEGFIKVSK
ncbi:MAG: efflux RND transporter periplasmic adaptor subunit [Ginsengibacter sp.]